MKYKETSETWNKLASVYEEKFMDLDIYNETYDAFCDLVKTNNAKILELGCGPGNITRYLLQKRKDFLILGTDVAPNMLELAKQNNPSASFMQLDTRDMLQLTEKYDGIIAGFIIPYLSKEDVDKFIVDANILLTEKGKLYISFVEGDESESGYQTGSTGDRMYFYYHDLLEMKKMFSKHRFSIVKEFQVNYTKSSGKAEIHTIIICSKN